MLLILKNQMQETLDTIKGEHQSETIKYFYKLFICDIDGVSNKLNKNLSVISLELILSFLLCISSDIEAKSFT